MLVRILVLTVANELDGRSASDGGAWFRQGLLPVREQAEVP